MDRGVVGNSVFA